jgi:hypothetical protein
MKYVVVKAFDKAQALQMAQSKAERPLQDYIFDALMDTGKVAEDDARREATKRASKMTAYKGMDAPRQIQELEVMLRSPQLTRTKRVKVEDVKPGDTFKAKNGWLYEVTRSERGDSIRSRCLLYMTSLATGDRTTYTEDVGKEVEIAA